MKNVMERMEEIGAKRKIADFQVKQKLPYEFKIPYAYRRAYEFAEECDKRGLNCHVSVGGLDSLTLYLWLQSIGIHVPGISVSHLEDMSIQRIHKQIGINHVPPIKRQDGTYWNKSSVMQEFGFPVISKSKARKIKCLQVPDNPKQTFIHAIMTGDMGEQGGYGHSSKLKLPDKWLKLFGGLYQEHRPDMLCQAAKFKVSDRCCYYLKEKPCDDWAKENNSVAYLGLMASEGGQREMGLMKNGCNYFGKSTIRSAPFAIFNRQDLLQLALELSVPVPEVYGVIKRSEEGLLYTTRAQRTGCSFCGFGIHLEKRPHRFDRLYQDNPKEWEYWMYRCVTDPETGEQYGWNRVLDYIGVGWRPETLEMEIARQKPSKKKKVLVG
ncbi:hypothetical protein SDC9_129179 [bioreactor metagenome]|uniref:Phosphoadenosine phosphosulphate reductase domain-containing protein n=1 Tax=bioreactor metagenome TaxID=1076179 RepID=A0A645CZ11_9ZZZZ